MQYSVWCVVVEYVCVEGEGGGVMHMIRGQAFMVIESGQDCSSYQLDEHWTNWFLTSVCFNSTRSVCANIECASATCVYVCVMSTYPPRSQFDASTRLVV